MFYRRGRFNKRGQSLLLSTIITIILNVVFISLMVLFLTSKMKDLSSFEEAYSKQIALALDAALPGMTLEINMSEVFEKSRNKLTEEIALNAVTILGNEVNIKFSPESQGYSYYFFNDVKIIGSYFDYSKKSYIILVGGYS